MITAKELIDLLIYWAQNGMPERKDVNTYTFTIGEMKSVLKEMESNSDAYQHFCAQRSNVKEVIDEPA